MQNLAEEHLTEAILNQLSAWPAEKDCVEYTQIDRHRPVDKFSEVITWNSGTGDVAFALVIFSESVVATVQSAIDAEDAIYESYIEHIEDWAVYRAVDQDNGGPFLWLMPDDVLTGPFYYR